MRHSELGSYQGVVLKVLLLHVVYWAYGHALPTSRPADLTYQ